MEIVDCENLLCPLPVLRARKRLLGLASGTVICVRATDPMARIDLPHFCHESGHTLLSMTDLGRVTEYVIRRN